MKLESTRSKIKVMEYEYMNEVSFNHGGMKNLLRKSHGKCIRYMEHLVYNLDYQMTGYFAITGELHPLPPSYKDRVWTLP